LLDSFLHRFWFVTIFKSDFGIGRCTVFLFLWVRPLQLKLTRFVQIQEVRPVVQPLGEPSLLVAVVSARARGYIYIYLQLLWLDAQLSSQLNSQCSSIYLRADRPGWVKLVDQSVGLSTSWHGFPNHIYLKLTVRHCCVNLSIRKNIMQGVSL